MQKKFRAVQGLEGLDVWGISIKVVVRSKLNPKARKARKKKGPRILQLFRASGCKCLARLKM